MKLPLYPKKKRRRNRVKQRWPDRDHTQNWRAEQPSNSSEGQASGQTTPASQGGVKQHSLSQIAERGLGVQEVSPSILNVHVPANVADAGKSHFKKEKANIYQLARDDIYTNNDKAEQNVKSKKHSGSSKAQARSKSRQKSSQVVFPDLLSHNNPVSTKALSSNASSLVQDTNERDQTL